MAYNGLTKAGEVYLATRQANKLPVDLLNAKVGNGIVPSGTNPAELTDIVSEKMEVELIDIQQVENALKMAVQVSNENLTTGFYLTEIAIFVNDNGTPVLYWYIGKDNGTYVPDSTKPMKYKNILNIEVSSTPVTNVNYTGKDVWVDREYLENELEKKDEQDKGILGKSNGKFPLSSATQGNVYLLEETKKYYICTTAYSGTEISVPNANFEELSVFQNRNKLENLSKIKLIFNNKQTTETGIFTLDDSIENYKFINIVYAFSSDSTGLVSVGSAVFNTDFLKSHYNSGLSFANISITENGVNVTLEYMYVKFINGTQINIEENGATNNAVLSNNKIYQIYAWN